MIFIKVLRIHLIHNTNGYTIWRNTLRYKTLIVCKQKIRNESIPSKIKAKNVL